MPISQGGRHSIPRGAAPFVGEANHGLGYEVVDTVVPQSQTQPRQFDQGIDNPLNHNPVCFRFCGLVFIDEGCQGRHQSDDLLLGNFHAATQELSGVGLGCGCLDKVGTANQYAGALGTTNSLAAAVDHHVSSCPQVAVQVGAGWQHGSCVDDDRYIVGVGDLADVFQGQNPVAGEGRA